MGTHVFEVRLALFALNGQRLRAVWVWHEGRLKPHISPQSGMLLLYELVEVVQTFDCPEPHGGSGEVEFFDRKGLSHSMEEA